MVGVSLTIVARGNGQMFADNYHQSELAEVDYVYKYMLL